MTLRLLTKREIDKKKSVERQREIDEGMKISRRVDSLREIEAEESASLDLFRTTTIEGIHKEIHEVTLERNELKTEVSALEDRKAEALKPLTDEWTSLNIAKEALSVKESVLSDLSKDIYGQKETLDARELKLRQDERAIALKEGRIQLYLDKVQRESESSKNTAMEIDKIRNETILLKSNAELQFNNREENIKNREKNLETREKEVDAERQELAKERVRLADKEKTLERALKRKK